MGLHMTTTHVYSTVQDSSQTQEHSRLTAKSQVPARGRIQSPRQRTQAMLGPMLSSGCSSRATQSNYGHLGVQHPPLRAAGPTEHCTSCAGKSVLGFLPSTCKMMVARSLAAPVLSNALAWA